jgi:hypothetical protein
VALDDLEHRADRAVEDLDLDDVAGGLIDARRSTVTVMTWSSKRRNSSSSSSVRSGATAMVSARCT